MANALWALLSGVPRMLHLSGSSDGVFGPSDRVIAMADALWALIQGEPTMLHLHISGTSDGAFGP